MAIFSPGPMVAEVRGSVGGTTFSRNRGGAYARFRAAPTQPGTISQVFAKGIVTFLSGYWHGTLTQVQRDAWDAFAAANPIVNAVGLSHNIGGLGWFQRVNALRARSSIQFILTLPNQVLVDPPLDGTDPGAPQLSVTSITSAGLVTVVLNPTVLSLWADDPDAIATWWASEPQSNARQSPKGVRGRVFAATIGDGTTPITSPLSLTLPVDHPRPVVGQVVFFRGWVSLSNGRATHAAGWNRVVAT